jgi:hypothetical protein
MMPDIIGIFAGWLTARHFHKKGADDMARMEERLKNHINTVVNTAYKKYLHNATLEQRDQIQSTLMSSVKNCTGEITEVITNIVPFYKFTADTDKSTTRQGPDKSA